MKLNEFPGRVFLDSSTLQILQDYGEYVYDGGEIPKVDKIWSIPNGFKNVQALRQISFIAERGALQYVLSHNSMQEVVARGQYDYLQWASEVRNYWEECLSSYDDYNPAFNGQGISLSAKLEDNQFGYLSRKDALLIHDAVLLECDVFLTMEKKLTKNSAHVERELQIKILQPLGYWNLISPWAALFA